MGPGRDINNTSSHLTVHFPTQCKQRTPSSPNLEPLGHKRPSPLQSVVSVVQAHCLGVLVPTKELSLQIPSPPSKPPLWTDWINTWQRLKTAWLNTPDKPNTYSLSNPWRCPFEHLLKHQRETMKMQNPIFTNLL